MVWHLPIAGAVAGVAGLATVGKALSEGKNLEQAVKQGLGMTKDVGLAIGTLGLISPESGLDISEDGICYDPDHSCKKR